MSNIRIGYINYADTATLTTSIAAATGAPVSYLQNDARSDIWQSSAIGAQNVDGNWGGTAYTISQLTLWRHNLGTTNTVWIRLYSDPAQATLLYDNTALPAYSSGLFDAWGWAFSNQYFTPVAGVQSFRLRLGAGSLTPQASRLFLGGYVEAPINPAYGAIVGMENNSVQSRGEGGSLRSLTKADWRTMQMDMMVMAEADRAIWFEISRYCGISKSFVASLYPGVGGAQERDHTLYGKFDKPPAMKISGPTQFDFSMKILGL